MKSKDGAKKSSKETYRNGPHNRRLRARERLEVQLKSNTKVVKGGGTEPLIEKDVKRIEKEIETLKTK